MRKKRQFTRHEELTHAAGVAPIDQPEKWDVQLEREDLGGRTPVNMSQ